MIYLRKCEYRKNGDKTFLVGWWVTAIKRIKIIFYFIFVITIFTFKQDFVGRTVFVTDTLNLYKYY